MDGVICVPTDELENPTALRRLLDLAFDGGFREAERPTELDRLRITAVLTADAHREVLLDLSAAFDRERHELAHAAVVERTLRVGDWEVLTGYVESVATHPDHRGRGLGTAVMERVGAFIDERYGLGGLSAGIPAFYERIGWQRWQGPTFVRRDRELLRTPDDDGTVMVLATRSSAPFETTGPIFCAWRAGEVW